MNHSNIENERKIQRSLTVIILVADQVVFSPGNFKGGLALRYNLGPDKASSKKLLSWIQDTGKLEISACVHHE